MLCAETRYYIENLLSSIVGNYKVIFFKLQIYKALDLISESFENNCDFQGEMIHKRTFHDEDCFEFPCKHPKQWECTNYLAPMVHMSPPADGHQKPQTSGSKLIPAFILLVHYWAGGWDTF